MNAHIVRLDGADHDAIVELLPWYVVGTLPPEDAKRVRAHLGTCARCRAQCNWERRFARACSRADDLRATGETEAGVDALGERARAADGGRDTATGAPDAAAGLAALLPRLGTRGPRGRLVSWLRRRVRFAARIRTIDPRFGWVVAAQGVAIVVLAVALVRSPAEPPAFHALSASGHDAGGNAIVVFAAGVAERDVRAALREAGARVVDGPTAAGAWVLRADDATRAIAVLRARAGVVLAEPLQAAPRP